MRRCWNMEASIHSSQKWKLLRVLAMKRKLPNCGSTQQIKTIMHKCWAVRPDNPTSGRMSQIIHMQGRGSRELCLCRPLVVECWANPESRFYTDSDIKQAPPITALSLSLWRVDCLLGHSAQCFPFATYPSRYIYIYIYTYHLGLQKTKCAVVTTPTFNIQLCKAYNYR